jgi:hypothetical protein
MDSATFATPESADEIAPTAAMASRDVLEGERSFFTATNAL